MTRPNGTFDEDERAAARFDGHGPTPRRVLIVDDSRLQRHILSASLRRWGYLVDEAESGSKALEICRKRAPDFVISDWMMPEMNGQEFCQAFRAMERDSYGYFILLTSKAQSHDAAKGLDAGADDFLTKPISADELRARLSAGERILRMERELVEKNRLVSSTLAELQGLYDALDDDLAEARKLQQSLVRERHRRFGSSQVSLMLRPRGHVGGDLVGFFPIGETGLGLFAIDVSGHGVASALMTARLAGQFSGAAPERNIALVARPEGGHAPRPPEEVAAHLNRQILAEIETETYFTLLYAEVDLASGRVRLVQAGHPHPAILRADGRVEFIGAGGLPVGLLPEADFESHETRLAPGDRLFIVSDGITECESPGGRMLEEPGLRQMMGRSAHLTGPDFLDSVAVQLSHFAGGGSFSDDLSAILFEFDFQTGGQISAAQER